MTELGSQWRGSAASVLKFQQTRRLSEAIDCLRVLCGCSRRSRRSKTLTELQQKLSLKSGVADPACIPVPQAHQETLLLQKQDFLADRWPSPRRAEFLPDTERPDAGSAICLRSQR